MGKRYLPALLAACMFWGCGKKELLGEGVSRELASWRKERISDISYNVSFAVPEEKGAPVTGEVTINFLMEDSSPVIMDFTGGPGGVHHVSVNGKESTHIIRNQHIVVPKGTARVGRNSVKVRFTATEQSLNRRDEFLYTLLVPDRARTLFPCFDQPDLKGRFTLALEIPEEWNAVGNGSISSGEDIGGGRKKISFRPTEPISTYLFSFVCGLFEKVTREEGGREISIYHRETDEAKKRQTRTIFDEVFHSLEWLEDYTGMDYPFEKYDLVILPGFQYGGMEHMGATLYNDRRMFLEPNATEAERLGRSSLIAHETAHMWFGDLVTMEWFSDVWNKEVFANWFAARIVRPMYPRVNHDINFIRSYVPLAYSDDRTGGSVPIQQSLDNLNQAGLVYGNIVYDKSPVVMEMLVRKAGEAKFREGIREYLRMYAYGNTNWDGLVEILDGLTEEDLTAWSRNWVKEKGMPHIRVEAGGDSAAVTQSDPWGRGILWEQDLTLGAVRADGRYSTIKTYLRDKHAAADLPPGTRYVIPNIDGAGYGYFRADSASTSWMLANWSGLENDVARYSVLINLYEGIMNLDIEPERFMESLVAAMPAEKNFQIFRQILSYAESCSRLFTGRDSMSSAGLEAALLHMARFDSDPQRRTAAIQSFIRTASTPEGILELYSIWGNDEQVQRYGLSESDLTSISYELAVRFPDDAEHITGRQLQRITNPDRRKEYEFVSRAVAASSTERDAFFNELLDARNREVEPWAARALRLLNHPCREKEAVKYIRPALNILTEVQRTGDIFFPANWLSALLEGHSSVEALHEVESFLAAHPNYPALLKGKIKLKADHLYVISGELERRYVE